MIAIIDYEMGNIGSVLKAFSYINCRAEEVTDPDKLKKYDNIVLPGVGAFPKAMDNLKKRNMDQAVKEEIKKGKNFLGICLGYQLLFESSEEDFSGTDDKTAVKGLCLLSGHVRKFNSESGLKVPQIGWNSIDSTDNTGILHQFNGRYFYFVHSYYADVTNLNSTKNDVKSLNTYFSFTEYGKRFASAVEKDNIMACQFHPEKSGDDGIELLRKWVKT
ncbi:MAG TPA: imidazole glycerol phosphate synthase subunit HisH [Clostridia bacterium]|nr:imidazole glycerol phosphate synthase subunit HisH [Clostridia bacterium]HPB16099.1 imidazole glycerol phosphate synthase subunit HisH [Clostridia bacterium]HQM96109.1 imidazole glycerol phosphate synthase subunit HisH [Clostridia bacterium]HQO68883.1 imidazole glycerol phosphate synthase subunit HisH [Clostridia bacterium]